jgi:hypothetical protein
MLSIPVAAVPIVSIWAAPYSQMLKSNMPRDARASSFSHAMLNKVALAGPKSLHIITRVASSLAGQLRMMTGPVLCSKWRRARNKCNSRFSGSFVSKWHEIIEVFTAVCFGCQWSFHNFQIVLRSAQQSLVKILNEWVKDGKHDWLHEVNRVIVSQRICIQPSPVPPHTPNPQQVFHDSVDASRDVYQRNMQWAEKWIRQVCIGHDVLRSQPANP